MQEQLIQQIFSTFENVVQPQRQELSNLEMVVWLKSVKKTQFPQSFRVFLHMISDEQLLLLYPSSGKLAGLSIRTDSMEVDERFTFINEDRKHYIDMNFMHPTSFLLNGCIYFIQNYNRQEPQHILIASLEDRRLLSIINGQTKPHGFRIQYSVNMFGDSQLLMFGGIDEQLNLLNYLESFSLIRCDWEVLQTRGSPPSPRHSHLSLATSSYLIIIGGSTSASPFEREEGQLQDCYSLDLKSMTWAQVQMGGTIPKVLCYGHLPPVSSKRFLYLHEDNFFLWSVDHLKVIDATHIEWSTVKHPRAHMVTPEYRYQSSVCYNPLKKQVYVFGGFSFTKVEPQSINSTLDRLQIIAEGDSLNIENFEVFNGEKLHDLKAMMKESPLKQQKKQFSDEDPSFAFADPEEDEDELTFEELLEREKKLQQEEDEKVKQPPPKTKKQQKKKKKGSK